MKEKLNITIDKDLKERLQAEAERRRVKIATLITEYALTLPDVKKEKQ